MPMIYTSGTWVTKAGNEEAFIDAWQELADWTTEQVEGNPKAMLLRDLEDRSRFISFGPWDDVERVAAWRALPGFQERVAKIRPLLEEFEARTLEIAADVG
jgi:quinol monooxygenase YgiN